MTEPVATLLAHKTRAWATSRFGKDLYSDLNPTTSRSNSPSFEWSGTLLNNSSREALGDGDESFLSSTSTISSNPVNIDPSPNTGKTLNEKKRFNVKRHHERQKMAERIKQYSRWRNYNVAPLSEDVLIPKRVDPEKAPPPVPPVASKRKPITDFTRRKPVKERWSDRQMLTVRTNPLFLHEHLFVEQKEDVLGANEAKLKNQEKSFENGVVTKCESNDDTISTTDSCNLSESNPSAAREHETYVHVFTNNSPSAVPAVDSMVDELLSLEYRAFSRDEENDEALKFDAVDSFEHGTDSWCSITEYS